MKVNRETDGGIESFESGMKYITITKYIEIPVRCRVPIAEPDPCPSVGLFGCAAEGPELTWDFEQEIPSELVEYVLQEDAERAAEWMIHEILGCVVSCRAVRSRFQRQDLFAADVIGKRPDGSNVYIQATAGQYSAVTSRRRKLEKIPWHKTDTVAVAQLVQTEDPANSRRKLWFFRMHYYSAVKKEWISVKDAVEVPRLWFTAYKNRNEKDVRK